MKDKVPPQNQNYGLLTWFPFLFINILISSSVSVTQICWKKFFVFWKHELMQRNTAMENFHWWWNQFSKRYCGVCNASRRESKTVISHNIWKHQVLPDRGLDLSLKKVIFLMKTKLNILSFPLSLFFFFLLHGEKICICLCVHVLMCEREREKEEKG